MVRVEELLGAGALLLLSRSFLKEIPEKTTEIIPNGNGTPGGMIFSKTNTAQDLKDFLDLINVGQGAKGGSLPDIPYTGPTRTPEMESRQWGTNIAGISGGAGTRQNIFGFEIDYQPTDTTFKLGTIIDSTGKLAL